MCKDRCATIESAFGTRVPLPPRIASLDVEPAVPSNAEIDTASPEDKYEAFIKALESCIARLRPNASAPSRTCKSTIFIPEEDILISLRTLFLEVPAFGPNIPVRLTDVVASGSEEPQAKLTTEGLEVATPYSILLSINQNVDIVDVLLLNCPDFPTLFALVASCTATKRAFERHSTGIITAVLKKMPQELQYLTVALIGINGSQINSPEAIRKLMDVWLGMGEKPLPERLQKNPFQIIKTLARSFSAIDLFMEVIPKNCVNNFIDYQTVVASREGLDYYTVNDWTLGHPKTQQTEYSDVPDDTDFSVPSIPSPKVGPQEISLPLNPAESYRIKRALLRYEVFCALFYLRPDYAFDTTRHPHRFNRVPESSSRRAFRKEQVVFFENYVNPWEIGELAVVTHFMFDLVRNAYFHKYKQLRSEEAYKSRHGRRINPQFGFNRHHDHDDVVDEFDNFVVWFASQGLNLLRNIYHGRHAGYRALITQHGAPRYRPAEFFLPIEECTDRRGYGFATVPNASWTPRATWSDTPGMELPSAGWLAKSPTTATTMENTAYWGEKWMRKIGYFIWDRKPPGADATARRGNTFTLAFRPENPLDDTSDGHDDQVIGGAEADGTTVSDAGGI